jgi:hypothetical protein
MNETDAHMAWLLELLAALRDLGCHVTLYVTAIAVDEFHVTRHDFDGSGGLPHPARGWRIDNPMTAGEDTGMDGPATKDPVAMARIVKDCCEDLR